MPSPNIKLLSLLVIAVSFVVLTVHWPALSAKALSFDDNQYLMDNMLVQNPCWMSARQFLTEILEPSTVGGYYQPLAMISLMLDYALGGRENNLLPFHRTSLILHIANTALIIVMLYLLFGQIWIAAGVGLLFGVHPMTVEPIPWVGERKTLLAAFFSLWSLIFYVYSRKSHHARRTTASLYIGSLIAYLLALMSKPTSTPLPVVMLLLDYWPLRRLNWRTVLEKTPFFVLGGISAIITYISQSRTAGVTMPGHFGPERISLIFCHNIIFYFYKMIWPVNLSSHYPFPEPLNLSQPMVLAGVIGTFVLLALLVLSLRWTRAAMAGWLIFFVAILPTMQIIGFSDVIASDKFAYLPSIGLLMILAAFLVWLCNNRFLTLCRVSAMIIVLLACAESIAARCYLTYWRDTVSLFEHMLALAPNAVQVHNNLGISLQSLGRNEDAISHFQQALRLKCDYAEAHNNLGVSFQLLDRTDEAIEEYRKAIKIKPDYDRAYNNLGTALGLQGKFDEAIEQFSQALRIKPNCAPAHSNLGNALASIGRFDEAIVQIERAAALTKYQNAAILNILSAAYAAKGRFSEAIATAQKALDIAVAGQNNQSADFIRRRLEMYKQGKSSE